MGQTSLQRTEQFLSDISKRVKKAKLLNTNSLLRHLNGMREHITPQPDSSGLPNRARFRKIISERRSSLNPCRPHVSKVWLYFWAVRKATSQLYGKKLCLKKKKKKKKDDLGAKVFSWWGTVPKSLNSPFKTTWWKKKKQLHVIIMTVPWYYY